MYCIVLCFQIKMYDIMHLNNEIDKDRNLNYDMRQDNLSRIYLSHDIAALDNTDLYVHLR